MPSLEDLTTDQLLAAARQWQSQAALVEKLSTDPKTRLELQKLVKTVNPNAVFPELEAREAVRSEIEVERAERKKLEEKILEREVKDRLERQRAQVREAYKLTEGDMLEVEKMMVDPDPEKRMPTYDTAARVFAASKHQATPTPASLMPPTLDMPDAKDWKEGIGNPAKLNKIGLTEAFKAWNDITGGKQAA
jgi:hypothetical protein